jgi:hypothetical protein
VNLISSQFHIFEIQLSNLVISQASPSVKAQNASLGKYKNLVPSRCGGRIAESTAFISRKRTKSSILLSLMLFGYNSAIFTTGDGENF